MDAKQELKSPSESDEGCGQRQRARVETTVPRQDLSSHAFRGYTETRPRARREASLKRGKTPTPSSRHQASSANGMRRSRRGEIRVKASARKKRAKETHLAPGQDAARCPSRLVSRPASEPTILQVIPYGFVKRDARFRPPTARFFFRNVSPFPKGSCPFRQLSNLKLPQLPLPISSDVASVYVPRDLRFVDKVFRRRRRSPHPLGAWPVSLIVSAVSSGPMM